MLLSHRPNLQDWQSWSWDDYLSYFLCRNAAKSRAKQREPNVCKIIGETEFRRFCEPIRERITAKFSDSSPVVSIQMPTRNDAMELLATLVSYTLLDVVPGEAELIVADNASTDETPLVIEACGVKRAFAPIPGMGKARRAAYDCIAPTVEFVWLTDCDARVVPPLNRNQLAAHSTILQTNLRTLKERDNVIALSTGIVYEYTHPLFRILRTVALVFGKAPRIHAWTGPNQFIRRSAVDGIGGIHPDIPYRSREDHQRMYELARYAKKRGLQILSAATDARLYDPVYHSGRRRGTVADVVTLLKRGRHKIALPKDKYGWPIHPSDRISA